MTRALLFAIAIATALPALACINTYGTDLQGKPRETFFTGEDLVEYLKKPNSTDWRAEKRRLGQNLERASIEQRNDYAAALLHVGEIKPALAILVQIERTKPGLYATATNLGTAYELAGKNEYALGWIRAGIRRNPQSHDGSEWLHGLILEAKLALAKDAGWLRSHSVLGLDFGNAAIPKLPARFPVDNRGNRLDAVGTRSAIHMQMAERLQFVPAPDAIVGDLLFDYANLLMLTDTMENATAIYDLALRYGTPRAELARQRMAHARQVAKRAKK